MNRNNPFSHIRLVYRRTSPLVKCVVLTAIILSAVALVALRASIQASKTQQVDLQQQVAQLQSLTKLVIPSTNVCTASTT